MRTSTSRKLLTAIALGRIGIGATVAVAPAAVRVALPRAADTPDSAAALRMLAARDVALGLATLASLRARSLAPVVLATATSDLADAGVSLSRRSELPTLQWVLPAASGALAAGATLACVRALTRRPLGIRWTEERGSRHLTSL